MDKIREFDWSKIRIQIPDILGLEADGAEGHSSDTPGGQSATTSGTGLRSAPASVAAVAASLKKQLSKKDSILDPLSSSLSSSNSTPPSSNVQQSTNPVNPVVTQSATTHNANKSSPNPVVTTKQQLAARPSLPPPSAPRASLKSGSAKSSSADATTPASVNHGCDLPSTSTPANSNLSSTLSTNAPKASQDASSSSPPKSSSHTIAKSSSVKGRVAFPGGRPPSSSTDIVQSSFISGDAAGLNCHPDPVSNNASPSVNNQNLNSVAGPSSSGTSSSAFADFKRKLFKRKSPGEQTIQSVDSMYITPVDHHGGHGFVTRVRSEFANLTDGSTRSKIVMAALGLFVVIVVFLLAWIAIGKSPWRD